MVDGNGQSRVRSHRRTFLKTSAAALGIGGIQQVQGGLRDTVEIVFGRDGEGIVKTREVPKSWYQQKNHVEKVFNNRAENLLNIPGVESVGIGLGKDSVRNYRKNSISVAIGKGNRTQQKSDSVNDKKPSALNTPDEDIPDQIKGVPVKKSTSGPLEHQTHRTEMKAGERLASGVGEGGSMSCQLAFTGYGDDNVELQDTVLTARHMFVSGSQCGTMGDDLEGEPAYYKNNGSFVKMGQVHHHITEWDIAVIDTDASFNATDDIIQETESFDGYVTQDGLSSLASFTGDEVEIRGASTGASTSHIIEYDKRINNCPGDHIRLFEQVVLKSSPSEPGDSGGAIYYKDGSDTLHAAMITGTLSNYDCGWSCFGGSDRTTGSATYALPGYPY